MENTDRHRDGEDDIIRRIKIDPPTLNDTSPEELVATTAEEMHH